MLLISDYIFCKYLVYLCYNILIDLSLIEFKYLLIYIGV